jgi:glycosyltransferase involved in cell wall biosynthesis
MRKKVTYIVSDMNKMIALEWVCNYHDNSNFELSFVFLNNEDTEIETFVRNKGYKYLRVHYNGKRDLFSAFIKTRKFLKSNKIDVVHCHLFDACIIGLFASLFTQVKKRIHTRHYATYHHTYFPKAVKYDLIINKLSTDIISISKLVSDVLISKEGVKKEKVHLIHHGFLVSEYSEVNIQRIDAFKKKYGIKKEDIIIGVVARYTILKGIQYIIPAFKKFLAVYPNAKLLIANSHGNDEVALKKMLFEHIPNENIIEVKYERDMGALYQSLFMYIHTPIYDHIEAFGQTYVESLMAKVPSIFTLSGVAQEFIKNKHNALVVPFQDSEAIYQSMELLMSDSVLVENLKINGYNSAVKEFSLKPMIDALQRVYLRS